jgi:hypothetical protein
MDLQVCDVCGNKRVKINLPYGFTFACVECHKDFIEAMGGTKKPLIHRNDEDGGNEVHRLIQEVCNETATFLIGKNKKYGNSALNPIRIFSKAEPLEQINVRIDDKINRLYQGGEYPGDDDEKDLLGYLVLKEVGRRFHGKEKSKEDTTEQDKERNPPTLDAEQGT